VILMPESTPDKRSVLFGVIRTGVSAIVAAVAVIFFFGGREAKINDLVAWKADTAPIIKRMDTTGTLSFDIFHKQYEKDQARVEKRLENLEAQR
jgi:hypothetical protein